MNTRDCGTLHLDTTKRDRASIITLHLTVTAWSTYEHPNSLKSVGAYNCISQM